MLKKKTISKVELAALAYLLPLGWIHCNSSYFPVDFPNPEIHGATFRAMPDFYHPVYDAYIEVKDSGLNTMKSPEDAKRRYESSLAQEGMKKNLDFGWNHSCMKQSIVQQTLSPWKFTVVFVNGLDDAMKKRVVNNGVHAYTSLKALNIWLFNLELMHSEGKVLASMTKAFDSSYIPLIGKPRYLNRVLPPYSQ